jgi:hypothetical protein
MAAAAGCPCGARAYGRASPGLGAGSEHDLGQKSRQADPQELKNGENRRLGQAPTRFQQGKPKVWKGRQGQSRKSRFVSRAGLDASRPTNPEGQSARSRGARSKSQHQSPPRAGTGPTGVP